MKFGELSIRQRFETSSYKVTKEEIIAFAAQFDPQCILMRKKRRRADSKDISLRAYIL